MEVHHHPQVEKKSFKEYLLEGLMIFIAVILGFFAETIRENINEHSRAKGFAVSMVNDLTADTAELVSYITYYTYAVHNTDTLMQLLSVAEPAKIPSGKLYWYGLWGGAHHVFIPNDATFEQMKSSGSLRYFDKGVAVDVARYDRLCRQMQDYSNTNHYIYTEVRRIRAKLFAFHYNDVANTIAQKNKIKIDQNRIDSFIATNPPLLSSDKIVFNEYIEMVRSRFLNLDIALAKSMLDQATKLIDQLGKTYSLKNE